jgi:hypothetical protein
MQPKRRSGRVGGCPATTISPCGGPTTWRPRSRRWGRPRVWRHACRPWRRRAPGRGARWWRRTSTRCCCRWGRPSACWPGCPPRTRGRTGTGRATRCWRGAWPPSWRWSTSRRANWCRSCDREVPNGWSPPGACPPPPPPEPARPAFPMGGSRRLPPPCRRPRTPCGGTRMTTPCGPPTSCSPRSRTRWPTPAPAPAPPGLHPRMSPPRSGGAGSPPSTAPTPRSCCPARGVARAQPAG